jgi:hypothetical protein
MLTRLKSIWRNEKGVAAMEFAMLIPFLLLLFAGSIEVTFKIWSAQKAEKLAVTLADVIAQSQTVSLADLDSLTGAVDKIMDPFSFSGSGVVIISSVYVAEDETDPKVNWQYVSDDRPTPDPDAGDPPLFDANSEIGQTGDDANMPDDFTLAPRDNVIVAEVFYEYKPILPGLLFGQNALIPALFGNTSSSGEDVVYRPAFFKPRLGALIDPPE